MRSEGTNPKDIGYNEGQVMNNTNHVRLGTTGVGWGLTGGEVRSSRRRRRGPPPRPNQKSIVN